MKIRLALAFVACLAATAPALDASDFEWRGHVASGQILEIKGVNGSIDATGASGSNVEVRATKTSRRSDSESVEIKVLEHGDGVTICAVYPTPASSRQPNECRPGDGGRMNTQDNDVQVNFVVRVPAGVRLAARTVNGNVEAEQLDSDAEIRTVNGSIRVETRGHAEATTVNGSIRAAMGRADWRGKAAFRTVNGSIHLDLPPDTSTDVAAKTVNGGIESDFSISVRGRFSRRSLQGTIGSGGRELELETVNGGIRLNSR
jgi:hypothetical protein